MASATATYSNMAAHTHSHTHLPSIPRLPSSPHFSSAAPALHGIRRLALNSSTARAKFDKFQGQDSIGPVEDEDDGDSVQPQFELDEEEDDRCAYLALIANF